MSDEVDESSLGVADVFVDTPLPACDNERGVSEYAEHVAVAVAVAVAVGVSVAGA